MDISKLFQGWSLWVGRGSNPGGGGANAQPPLPESAPGCKPVNVVLKLIKTVLKHTKFLNLLFFFANQDAKKRYKMLAWQAKIQ